MGATSTYTPLPLQDLRGIPVSGLSSVTTEDIITWHDVTDATVTTNNIGATNRYRVVFNSSVHSAGAGVSYAIQLLVNGVAQEPKIDRQTASGAGGAVNFSAEWFVDDVPAGIVIKIQTRRNSAAGTIVLNFEDSLLSIHGVGKEFVV